MDSIIGQGERLTARILAKLFPDGILWRQVPLKDLLAKDFIDEIGERASKETIDLVLFRPKPLAIRVQDDRHKSERFAVIDMRQKWELEESNVDVIDIWKSDCPALFREKNIDKAEIEIKKLFANYLE